MGGVGGGKTRWGGGAVQQKTDHGGFRSMNKPCVASADFLAQIVLA